MRDDASHRMGDRLRPGFLRAVLRLDSRRRPVVFLQGDRLRPRDNAKGQWKDPSKFTDIDTADLQKMADSFSTMQPHPAMESDSRCRANPLMLA